MKLFFIIGCISAGLSVALGAFGAHGLTHVVSPADVSVFQTGVQYQMYHTLALMLVGIVYDRLPNKWLVLAGYLFSLGVLFFSGSLYLITALKVSARAVPAAVGILTPVGGLLFIAGWLCFLFGLFKRN